MGESPFMTEIEELEDRWIERHSVNCYFCNALVDERNCLPADNYNGNDGGDICPTCLDNVILRRKKPIGA
tara:strand:- start:440 stop:649 length:210 start_codon:yes stop_codon:yes gene_type:complete